MCYMQTHLDALSNGRCTHTHTHTHSDGSCCLTPALCSSAHSENVQHLNFPLFKQTETKSARHQQAAREHTDGWTGTRGTSTKKEKTPPNTHTQTHVLTQCAPSSKIYSCTLQIDCTQITQKDLIHETAIWPFKKTSERKKTCKIKQKIEW